jgi:hypothetical protein
LIAGALALAAERLGVDAERVLARIRGLDLRAVAARHEIVAAVRAPVPPSLRHLHGSWIEHALDALPARTRTALTGPRDAVDVWLARWATAAVPPAITRRDPLPWLTAIGMDQFAYALGEQARALPGLATALARIREPPRAGNLGPKRAAIARCRDVSLDDELALVRVACRALAPHLAAHQLDRLQLILTLPRPIALVVAAELALAAATSFDQCPTWAAIAAQ